MPSKTPGRSTSASRKGKNSNTAIDRDDDGKFMSDDDTSSSSSSRSRSASRSQAGDDRFESDRDTQGSHGGWFGDSEGHSRAAHARWDERGPSTASSSAGRYNDQYAAGNYGGNDDRAYNQSGWYGDAEGNGRSSRGRDHEYAPQPARAGNGYENHDRYADDDYRARREGNVRARDEEGHFRNDERFVSPRGQGEDYDRNYGRSASRYGREAGYGSDRDEEGRFQSHDDQGYSDIRREERNAQRTQRDGRYEADRTSDRYASRGRESSGQWRSADDRASSSRNSRY